jgi:hypothetical protein
MPSEHLERYAEIARHSTRGVAAKADPLTERVCALVPEFRFSVRKPRPHGAYDALWAAVPLLFWWGFVLIVFALVE